MSKTVVSPLQKMLSGCSLEAMFQFMHSMHIKFSLNGRNWERANSGDKYLFCMRVWIEEDEHPVERTGTTIHSAVANGLAAYLIETAGTDYHRVAKLRKDGKVDNGGIDCSELGKQSDPEYRERLARNAKRARGGLGALERLGMRTVASVEESS